MIEWDKQACRCRTRILLALLASLLAVSVCKAQAVAPADSSRASPSDQLAEILVTAQKRTQDLQDVPIAVSVLGSGTLEKIHLDNPGDLAGLVPNLLAQNVLGAQTP